MAQHTFWSRSRLPTNEATDISADKMSQQAEPALTSRTRTVSIHHNDLKRTHGSDRNEQLQLHKQDARKARKTSRSSNADQEGHAQNTHEHSLAQAPCFATTSAAEVPSSFMAAYLQTAEFAATASHSADSDIRLHQHADKVLEECMRECWLGTQNDRRERNNSSQAASKSNSTQHCAKYTNALYVQFVRIAVAQLKIDVVWHGSACAKMFTGTNVDQIDTQCKSTAYIGS